MVQTRLNKKANVSLRRVLKNNGLMLDGLSFTKSGSRLSPTVYLNAYYNEAEEGMPEEASDEHIETVEESETEPENASAKEEAEAEKLISDAIALDKAGCFAIVLEKVPAKIAAEVTRQVKAVTIGIGAGNGCDGQVLVYADAMGMTQGFKPKFLRHFAQVGAEITKGVQAYVDAVKTGDYPNIEESY